MSEDPLQCEKPLFPTKRSGNTERRRTFEKACARTETQKLTRNEYWTCKDLAQETDD